jgi:isopenicillin-N N-acyltransferase-like protein
MSTIAAEPFPIVCVTGDPRQRGFEHGRGLRERVTLAVDRYMERFAHFAQLDRQAARREAMRYVDPIREYDPAILEEIEGLADGAGLPFEDVLAMNCRSELMFGSSVIMECSSFALQPSITEDGHTYVGQNWDWAPDIVETLAIVAIRQEPEGPDVVLLDEAGIVGRMGFNSSGLALCTNTLIADQARRRHRSADPSPARDLLELCDRRCRRSDHGRGGGAGPVRLRDAPQRHHHPRQSLRRAANEGP